MQHKDEKGRSWAAVVKLNSFLLKLFSLEESWTSLNTAYIQVCYIIFLGAKLGNKTGCRTETGESVIWIERENCLYALPKGGGKKYHLGNVAYFPWNLSPGSRMFWYSLEGTELEMGLMPNT